MELTEAHVILPRRFEPWRLWALGDVHWGAGACDEEAFKRTVAKIAEDEHAYWLGLGDYCDHIGHRDKRFDPSEITPDITVKDLDNIFNRQIRGFFDLVKPIKAKCIGMLCGNHEESVRLYSIQDPAKSLAEWMGVPDLRYSATIKIKVFDSGSHTPEKGRSRYALNLFAHHGWGGGRKSGAHVNRIEYDIMDMAPANTDIVFMGHVHKLIGGIRAGFRVSEWGPPRLIPYERAWAVTGTYLKTWRQGGTTYAERSGFPLSTIGSPCIEVRYCPSESLGARGKRYEVDVVKYNVSTASA